jgi:hypothetical protein
MTKINTKTAKSASEYAADIFKSKKRFHKARAKLPIEEKIKILVELQKIVLKTQKRSSNDESRRVWEI